MTTHSLSTIHRPKKINPEFKYHKTNQIKTFKRFKHLSNHEMVFHNSMFMFRCAERLLSLYNWRDELASHGRNGA